MIFILFIKFVWYCKLHKIILKFDNIKSIFFCCRFVSFWSHLILWLMLIIESHYKSQNQSKSACENGNFFYIIKIITNSWNNLIASWSLSKYTLFFSFTTRTANVASHICTGYSSHQHSTSELINYMWDSYIVKAEHDNRNRHGRTQAQREEIVYSHDVEHNISFQVLRIVYRHVNHWILVKIRSFIDWYFR